LRTVEDQTMAEFKRNSKQLEFATQAQNYYISIPMTPCRCQNARKYGL